MGVRELGCMCLCVVVLNTSRSVYSEIRVLSLDGIQVIVFLLVLKIFQYPLPLLNKVRVIVGAR